MILTALANIVALFLALFGLIYFCQTVARCQAAFFGRAATVTAGAVILRTAIATFIFWAAYVAYQFGQLPW